MYGNDFEIEDGTLKKYSGAGGDVVIPNGVTAISDYVFEERGDISSVTIPHSVTSIGRCAFYHCKNLTTVEIPHGVTSIGSARSTTATE